MFFLLPAAGAVIAAWRVYANRKKGRLTPERKAAFAVINKTVKDPVKLNKLASVFQKEGLTAQADALRARATLPDISPKVQAAWQKAFKDGLSSKNPDAVNKLADAFEKKGAGASASVLRQYAKGLQASAGVIPVSLPSLVTPPAPAAAPQAPVTEAAPVEVAPSPNPAAPDPNPPAPEPNPSVHGDLTIQHTPTGDVVITHKPEASL